MPLPRLRRTLAHALFSLAGRLDPVRTTAERRPDGSTFYRIEGVHWLGLAGESPRDRRWLMPSRRGAARSDRGAEP